MDQQTERALGDAVETLGTEAREVAESTLRKVAAAGLPTRRNRSLTRGWCVALVVAAVLGVVACYELATYFVAYTDDAYVRSDLIAVTPQVTGRIIAVQVVDNQTTRGGEPLVTIDPEPFELVIAQKKAEIAEATAQVDADHDAITAAQADADAAQARADLARATQRRMTALSSSGTVSRETLDKANDDLRSAEAVEAASAAAIARARSLATMHQAAQARAQAEMARAQWQLARTQVAAPGDGTISNLTIRIGDNAEANVPLIGIVDAHAWRVIANYKQSYLRELHVGQTAWIWLDSQPWHFHRARIAGIGRGISRDPAPEKLLPYVAPTTDWIRLQRRFPVTLTFDELPVDFSLYMGADARVVIFP